jgi:N-acetylglucosamine-6-sulfatase
MLALATAFLPVGCAAEAQVTVPERPNILVVLTDDQPYYTTAQMPELQSGLVGRGVSFSRAFLVDPLCCPTRATILTGKYTHNHHIVSNALPDGGAKKFRQDSLEKDTVATRLDAAGYSSGLFGKYMNGYDGKWIPPGWERWFAFIGDINREETYNVKDEGRVRTFSRQKWHETDLVADRAARFIESHQEGPWFALVAPHAPHGPYGGSFVPDRHRHDFDGARRGAADIPSFDEADISDKPFDAPRLSVDEKREIQKAYEGKLEALQAVDDLVGRLLGKLESTGQLDNTYVVYLTDNGYLLGEHRLTEKGQPYEESIRTPLIIRGPGVPVGQTRGRLAADVDLAPTIAGWAGTDSSGYDGRSLAPLLSDSPPQQWREALLIEHFIEEEGVPFSGVRTERYAYFERTRTEKKELYDLDTDRYELHNRFKSDQQNSTPPDPALVAYLEGRLQALRDCKGEACRTAENQAP